MINKLITFNHVAPWEGKHRSRFIGTARPVGMASSREAINV